MVRVLLVGLGGAVGSVLRLEAPVIKPMTSAPSSNLGSSSMATVSSNTQRTF